MKDCDLKVTYTRGSGPGGQRKNKVETCVEITHVPTGLHVRCQDTPSRARNEKVARQVLKHKLAHQKLQEAMSTRKANRDKRIKNKTVVRTYNYMTQQARNHLTGEVQDLKKTMNGDFK